VTSKNKFLNDKIETYYLNTPNVRRNDPFDRLRTSLFGRNYSLKIRSTKIAMNRKRGFTLIETLFALVILTTGFFSVFSLLRKSISVTTTSINQLIAVNLAQEGVEIIRNIRDTHYVSDNDWNDVLSSLSGGTCVDYEADIESTTLVDAGDPYLKINSDMYQYALGDESIFKRRISASNDGSGLCGELAIVGDCIMIEVDVSWSERGNEFTFSAEDYIYNFY
jgi:prepilin-type N-terminal cleavage/methylation domain-containing protein